MQHDIRPVADARFSGCSPRIRRHSHFRNFGSARLF